MDNLGVYGTQAILADNTIRSGYQYNERKPNSISLRGDQASSYQYITGNVAISAFDLLSDGVKTLRARLGNYGRTIYVDYKRLADYDYINIFEQDIELNFTTSTKLRPGVSFVKNISAGSTDLNVIIDNFHVEGKTEAPGTTTNSFTQLSAFSIDNTVLGNPAEPVPEKEDIGILPFLGMEPAIGYPDIVCGLSATYSNSDGALLSTVLYGISGTIGTVDIEWNATTYPTRFIFNYDGADVVDTGYVGTGSYNYTEDDRQTFIAGLSNSGYTQFTGLSIAPDGYPYIDSTIAYALSTFYKGTDKNRIATHVYDPLSGKDWEVYIGCPYRKIACGETVTFECGVNL